MTSLWCLIPALWAIAITVTGTPPTDGPVIISTTDPGTVSTATATTVPTANDSDRSHPATGHNNVTVLTTDPPADDGAYLSMFPAICVLYFLCIVLLVITLVKYTCCPDKNNNHCDHVKHYVASLLLSIVLNVVQEILAVFGIYFCSIFCLLKLFMFIATCGWQIVMSLDIYFYIRHITEENEFKKKKTKFNIYYHLGCWGTSTVLTLIRYIWFPTTYHKNTCLNSGYKTFYFPISGLFIIIVNVALQFSMIARYNAILKNISDQGVNSIQLKEKVMARKRMLLLVVILWFPDIGCWIANEYHFCESDLHITSYIDLLKQAKIVQGIFTFYIYIFDSRR